MADPTVSGSPTVVEADHRPGWVTVGDGATAGSVISHFSFLISHFSFLIFREGDVSRLGLLLELQSALIRLHPHRSLGLAELGADRRVAAQVGLGAGGLRAHAVVE